MYVTLRSSTSFEQHAVHPAHSQRAARNMLRSVV